MAKPAPGAAYRVVRGTNVKRSLTLALPPGEDEVRFEPGDIVRPGDYPPHTNLAWLIETGAWEVVSDG